MTYDPKTVVERYIQTVHFAEDDAAESACALGGGSGPALQTVGCEPGGCQNCCLGVVEVVRQFSESAAKLDTKVIEFEDTQTISERVMKRSGRD